MNTAMITFLIISFVFGGEWGLYKKLKLINARHALISCALGDIICVIALYSYIGLRNFNNIKIGTLILFAMSLSICYEIFHYLLIKKINEKKKQYFDISKKHSLMIGSVFILGITLFLELFLFNYKYVVTKNNVNQITDYDIGNGLENIGENRFQMLSDKNCFVRFADFSSEINSIKVNINRMSKINNRQEATLVTYYANDKANASRLKLGSRNVIGTVESSQYAIFHLKGESNEVLIEFSGEIGDVVELADIELNPTVPIMVSYWRVFVLYIIISLIVIFRPKSCIYDYVLSKRRIKQWFVVVIFIVLESFLFGRFVMANIMYDEPKWKHHRQYQELAVALSNGHFYLDEEPSDTLKNMDNPYDKVSREIAMKESGDTYLWDHAYYDGKYYVYFGIVPELVFYYPYYQIMHKDFNTVWGIIICGILFIIAMTQLLRIIIEKWFKTTSFGVYLLIVGVMVNSTGLLYIMSHPDFYDLPIIMALMFALWGLFFWVSALREQSINGIYLTLGSVCNALIVGCRPQLVLLSFVAFPLFMRRIVKDRALFSKKTILKTISAFVPYIVVAIFIMYYNYSRFNSIFDFGANYNLTTNDMTNRFPSIQLCLIGLFVYMFQPINLGLQFPFVFPVKMNFSYLGNNIWETMYGGLITCNPILLLGMKLKDVKGKLRKKEILALSLFFIVLSFVITIIDIIGAGILPRYISDFSVFLFLGIVLIILALNERYEMQEMSKIYRWRKVILFLSIISFVYNFIMIFANTSTYLPSANAELYYKICYAFQFWL